MKLIPLSKGLFAKIDDADYSLVAKFAWWSTTSPHSKTNYAEGFISSRKKKIKMHHLITGERRVDHRNGDGLDNQRSNLRPCTHAQNMKNRRPRSGTKAGFKGVYYSKGSRKWVAEIVSDGQWHYLGLHLTPRQAALAYNEAAIKYHGEFARLNEVR